MKLGDTPFGRLRAGSRTPIPTGRDNPLILNAFRNEHSSRGVCARLDFVGPQELLLSAYKAYPSFRGESAVSTWLYRITINACLMRARKQKPTEYLEDTGYEDMRIPGFYQDPEEAALNSELRAQLLEGLSRLPPEMRAALP